MRKRAYTILLFSFFLVFLGSEAEARVNRYSSASVSRGRALAMGGAFHSLVDDFSAGLYNPGALRLNSTRDERNLRLFFNPLGMGIGFVDYANYDRQMARDDNLTVEEGLLAASLLFKGFAYTTPFLDFGMNLGEEILSTDPPSGETRRFFSIREQTFGSMYSAFANMKIATTVSLGVNGTLYHSRTGTKSITKSGFSFGVLLNPNPRLNVGIVYHEIPEEFDDARFPLEDIDTGTVTSGISYYPDDQTVISIDLRNLNKDDRRASREIHSGIERIIADRFALRAGYFRKKETDHDIYSFGVGILPLWERITKFRNSMRSDLVTYTVVIDKNGDECYWHLFSFLLRY